MRSLLLGLLFSDTENATHQEQALKTIVEEVANLFSDDLAVDALSLNHHDQLKQAIQSITPPFYTL